MDNQIESCISGPLKTSEGDTRGNWSICYEKNTKEAKMQVSICSQQEGTGMQDLESMLGLDDINDLIEWLSVLKKDIQDQS